MNFHNLAYYAYIIHTHYIIYSSRWSTTEPVVELRTITFLFARLTRTDGSALGLMHRRPGAGFAPVERHRVVAHSGPFLLPFAAPGTAFGPLRPRRPASVHCENKHIHRYYCVTRHCSKPINTSYVIRAVRFLCVSFAIIYMKPDRRYNIPIYIYTLFHSF